MTSPAALWNVKEQPDWVTEFQRCAPWIRAALEATAVPTLNIGDVFAQIARDEAQLHAFPNCCFVTVLDQYSQTKTVTAHLGSGDMAEMVAVTPQIEEWAREQGCTHAFVAGRPGWERVLKRLGYRVDKVILVKEL